MAATRKLQGEIDRCLKKVTEGVETFEDIWQKVHNATNSNQKEKYEADLKKEIKKLQRLRDQIKSWIASAEIKDKSTLLDYRKLIETQMERFKVVERETKTKAYSKEGLGAVQKMDPAQKEKEEMSNWLINSIEQLNIQLDQFESEIEALLVGKKKRLDKDKQDRMDELKAKVERHRYHIRKLETLLRMLDNMSVEVDQVLKLNSIHLCSKIRRIKEDVEYYIESSQEPDFEENEYIYDDIEGLDELELAGVLPSSATTDSNGSPNSVTSNSPHSPLVMNHSNECSSVEPPSSQAPGSEKKSKSKLGNSMEEHSSKGMVKPTALRPQQAPSSLVNNIINSSSSSSSTSLPVSSPPPVTTMTTASLLINSITASSTLSKSIPTPQTPTKQQGSSFSQPSTPSITHSNHVPQPLTPSSQLHPSSLSAVTATSLSTTSSLLANGNNFAAVAAASSTATTNSQKHQINSLLHHMENGVQQQTGMSSSQTASMVGTTPSNSTVNNTNEIGSSSPPSSISSAPSPTPLPPTPPPSAATLQPTPQQPPQPPQSNTPTTMTSLKNMAQDVIDKAGLDLSQPQSESNHQMEVYNENLVPSEALIPYMLGVVPLGHQPLVKEQHHYQHQMLENGFLHLPHPADSERLRHYITRTPCSTPSYYPQVPLPHSDTLEYFQKLSTETLFFIFYYMEGTKAQYLAAKALKKQSWRFHTKYMMWFQRHEEPKLINEDYEQGTYIYFDVEKWSQRKKEGFTFEYKYLEDRDLN